MDYFEDDASLKRMLAWRRKNVDEEKQGNICPLLKLYERRAGNITSVTVEKLRRQMDIVRKNGYENIGFFADYYLTESLAKELKNSIIEK